MRRKGIEARGSIRGCSKQGRWYWEEASTYMQVRVVWNALIGRCGPRLNERPGGPCTVSETNERKKEKEKSRLETILKKYSIQIAINNKISTVKLRKILWNDSWWKDKRSTVYMCPDIIVWSKEWSTYWCVLQYMSILKTCQEARHTGCTRCFQLSHNRGVDRNKQLSGCWRQKGKRLEKDRQRAALEDDGKLGCSDSCKL